MPPHIKPVHIIGLCGKAGTGKDTAALSLSSAMNYHDIDVWTFAIADPMRAALHEMLLSIPKASELFDREHKERHLTGLPGTDLSPRRLLQEMGDMGRSLHPDFWIALLNLRVQKALSQSPSIAVIVTDIRLVEEADWVRAQGGSIWMLTRDAATPARNHTTERSISSITPDVVIDNNGTLPELHKAIRAALADHLSNPKAQ